MPVIRPITQLVPSPNGKLLAILTSHTVHVAILPDSTHLGGPDTGPIRVKTHTLGPTSHVLGQSPVMSALWHPLGVLGHCLVTVTADSIVRLWELNTENRWSFDSPALAMDLKKLADGTDAKEDYGAPGMGRNQGFSPDSFEMEVASACFGGTGTERENGWSAMTLWVAMKDGDLYALCPLLPSKWQPPPSLIPSLSVAVVSQYNYLKSELSTTKEELRRCQQRYAWVSDIDNQEPSYLPTGSEFDPEVEVYHRPVKVGSVPRLQGPFELDPTPDDGELTLDVQITDIHVIAAKLDDDDISPLGDEADSDPGESYEEGLAMNIVCLMTNHGRIHICLDVDGVEGTWLPERRADVAGPREEDLPTLLTLETIDTLRSDELTDPELSFPIFSSDPYSRHAFFATHGLSVSYLSLSPWLDQLESELQNGAGHAGIDFRLEIFVKSVSTLRERIIDPPASLSSAQLERSAATEPLTAAVVFRDSDLGYLVLTERCSQPSAASLESPDLGDYLSDDGHFSTSTHALSQSFSGNKSLVLAHLPTPPPRALYQPPRALWQASPLPSFLNSGTHAKYKRTLTEEIQLSHQTLILMTEAHKVLSQHTHQLGIAAAELFRRCERLQEEFRDQIRRADDLAGKIDSVTGDDVEEGEDGSGGGEGLVRRLERVKKRQDVLGDRYDRLRKRVGRGMGRGGRELSDRELAWGAEVEKLGETVLGDITDGDESENGMDEMRERYKTVRHAGSEAPYRSPRCLLTAPIAGEAISKLPHRASSRHLGVCRHTDINTS